jgi:hypothetical protein
VAGQRRAQVQPVDLVDRDEHRLQARLAFLRLPCGRRIGSREYDIDGAR